MPTKKLEIRATGDTNTDLDTALSLAVLAYREGAVRLSAGGGDYSYTLAVDDVTDTDTDRSYRSKLDGSLVFRSARPVRSANFAAPYGVRNDLELDRRTLDHIRGVLRDHDRRKKAKGFANRLGSIAGPTVRKCAAEEVERQRATGDYPNAVLDPGACTDPDCPDADAHPTPTETLERRVADRRKEDVKDCPHFRRKLFGERRAVPHAYQPAEQDHPAATPMLERRIEDRRKAQDPEVPHARRIEERRRTTPDGDWFVRGYPPCALTAPVVTGKMPEDCGYAANPAVPKEHETRPVVTGHISAHFNDPVLYDSVMFTEQGAAADAGIERFSEAIRSAVSLHHATGRDMSFCSEHGTEWDESCVACQFAEDLAAPEVDPDSHWTMELGESAPPKACTFPDCACDIGNPAAEALACSVFVRAKAIASRHMFTEYGVAPERQPCPHDTMCEVCDQRGACTRAPAPDPKTVYRPSRDDNPNDPCANCGWIKGVHPTPGLMCPSNKCSACFPGCDGCTFPACGCAPRD